MPPDPDTMAVLVASVLPSPTPDLRSPARMGARAFRAFYREHHGFVWHVARRLGVTPTDHLDVVQDTFVTAFRRRDERCGTSERAWLYGIARRVASNYRRGARRKARAIAAFEWVGGPRQAPALAEALVVLDRFVDGLAADEQQLFVLSEILGLSGPELAAALEWPASLVYGRLRMLRRRLAIAAPEQLFPALSTAREHAPRSAAGGWIAVWSMLAPPSAIAATVGLGLAMSVAAAAVLGPVAPPQPAATSTPTEAVATGTRADPRPPIATATTFAATPRTHAPAPRPPALRRSAAVQGPRAPVPDDLSRDNAVLSAALAAEGADDHARALALTDEHARRFPDSVQSDVRAAIRAEALCGLGKAAQARAEVHLLLERDPSTPLANRLRDACVERPHQVLPDADTTPVR